MATVEQPVIFGTAFEAVERAFGERLSPALRQALAGQGIDLAHPAVAYPLATWDAAVRRIAAELYPNLAPEAAWREMGREFMRGWTQTLVGSAAKAMGRLIGPRRLLERMGRNFRAAGNFSETAARATGDNVVELEIHMQPQFVSAWGGKPVTSHAYRAGVLEGSLHAIGVERVTVEILESDDVRQRTRYRVTWA